VTIDAEMEKLRTELKKRDSRIAELEAQLR
jgi:hypothetical protein